jgi:hypothetical protein
VPAALGQSFGTLQLGGYGEEDVNRDYLNRFIYRYVGKGTLFCSSSQDGGYGVTVLVLQGRMNWTLPIGI